MQRTDCTSVGRTWSGTPHPDTRTQASITEVSSLGRAPCSPSHYLHPTLLHVPWTSIEEHCQGQQRRTGTTPGITSLSESCGPVFPISQASLPELKILDQDTASKRYQICQGGNKSQGSSPPKRVSNVGTDESNCE